MAKPSLENVPTTTTTIHSSSSTSLQKTTKCIVCGREFSSRNKLFAHLKESECGAVVSASSGKNNDDNNKTNGQGDVGTVNGGNSHKSSNNSNNKPQLAKGNEAYYKYYQHQKICNNDEEWADAYRRLRTPLPVTYRIHESSTMGSEFTARLLSLVEKSEGREDDRKVFRHWSFDTTVSATTNSTVTTATNSANNNDDEEGDVGNVLPKLRMTITPHCHRRNKSSSNKDDGEDDVYSPILHALQELGAIHRQELVSAIPPLVLWTANSKAKGGNNNNNNKNSSGDAMIIADMCAAPGSKSLQLLDMLYYTSTSSHTPTTKPQNSTNNSTEKVQTAQTNAIHIPSGLLVVNDSDRHRIVTLCQRSRRVPRAPMLAINMDARYFPGMRRRCKPVAFANTTNNNTITNNNNTASKNNPSEKAGYKQKYATVLCDVPCTGDGTARKNAKIFSQWSVPHSMSLHRLQRRILKRALELLRPGGVVVYSTCSLNPVECEGVVASVIEEVGGVDGDGGDGGGGDGDGVSGVNDGGGAAMEIVPLHENLTKKCRPMRGLSTWKVPHPQYGKNENYAMYDAFDDVPTEHQGGMGEGNANDDAALEEAQQQRKNQKKKKKKKKKKKGGQINRSMFPPRRNSELARQLGNCGRFLPTEELDSGGFFVACIRRWKAGELGGRRTDGSERMMGMGGSTTSKKKAGDGKEVVVPAVTSSIGKMGRDETGEGDRSTLSVTTASTTSVGKPSKDESNVDNKESKPSATNIPTTNEQSHLLREGDWICTLCGKINFGRRGVGSRCFGCKARRHHSTTRATGDDNNNEEENANRQGVVVQQQQQQPLLVRPKASVLEAFFECFGIETGEERSFPLEHTRVIRRAKAKEHTIVVVSDALSKLAISESWGPVRELGVTLAAFPREEEQQNDGAGSTNTPPASFRLLDEGISILAQCATRRHFQLKPLDFVNALAQSVRQGCILAGGGGSMAESERVKATLDKSSVDVDSLGDKDAMWYDSLEEESMFLMWEACKASPGYFIVSCKCEIPASSSSSLEGGGSGGGGATTGCFSFCGCIDDGGNVEVKTSLRVMAAMLVVLHKYAEVVLLSSGDADHAPVTKRRRL